MNPLPAIHPRWRSALAPLALLLVGGTLFPTAGRDDKFITYWPAWTLAQWGEIVNYNGDRIEQSSSLLHVLLIGFATRISDLAPPITGWAIGVLAGVLGVVLTQRIAERCRPGMGLPAALLLAVLAPYAYWSFSGMETPLVAVTAVGMLVVVARAPRADPKSMGTAALALTAYLLVRPESPAVVLCVLAGLIGVEVARGFVPAEWRLPADDDAPSPRRFVPVLLLALSLIALIALLRLAYFDSPLPQPVYAKSNELGIGTLKKGVAYLFREGSNWLLVPLAALGALRVSSEALRGGASPLRVAIALFFVAYTSFIVLTGGGWMEATRFVGHMAPALAILCIEAVTWVPRPGAARALAAILIVVALAGSVRIAQRQSSSMPLWAILANDRPEDPRYPWIVRYNLSNRRDIEMTDAAEAVLTRLLDARGEDSPPVQVLAYNTGMVMYGLALNHYGRFATIDLHGLSDRFVTHSSHDDEIRRFALGLHWSIVDFFRLQPALEPETGVQAPDVVFCAAWPMDARGVAWVEDAGFHLAYWQLRDFDSGTRLLPGRGVEASQILAVRDALAEAVAGMPAVVIPPAPAQDASTH